MKENENILVTSARSVYPLPDESAHEGSNMEWWFVQGHYDGAHSGRRHFMASIFRHRLDTDSDAHPYSFSLLLSVMDPASGRQQTHSRIDQAMVSSSLSSKREVRKTNLDAKLGEAFAQEVARYGPPAPFVLAKTPARLTSKPLRIAWGDFSISQERTAFAIAFTEPDTGRKCRFTVSPTRPRVYIEGMGEPATASFPYATYPSLKLAGRVDSERVTGEAWFDHQWGGSGAWAVTKKQPKRLVGWDWFGINLDDGTDILLTVHRDMKNRRCIARSAMVRKQGRKPVICHDIVTTPLGYWTSDATQVTYPVSWRITIGEIGADLVFAPLADDQEIGVYGGVRAIWEGAGTVQGSLGKKRVTGRGRLELQGYGYIFDFKEFCGTLTKKIDQAVEAHFPTTLPDDGIRRFLGPPQWRHDASAYNETVARPVWDLMSRRGKQWRAIFNLLLLDALGVPHRPYLDLASVIPELCHTGSLIIDDIEDHSTMRRGDTCIHLRYGLDVAINAANTIYFLPFLLLADHKHLSEKQRAQIYKIVFRAFVRSHFGQGLDIHWARTLPKSTLAQWDSGERGEKILQMYADKTSSFIEAASESACIIAGADAATRAACIAFARTLGVAFQITDDVLNFSTSPRWGKTAGEDLAEGKLTYAIHRSLKALPAAGKHRLWEILRSERLRKKVAQTEGTELVRKSGALAECRGEAQKMVDDAWEMLSRYIQPSEPKIMLRMLCSSLLDIVYES